MAHYLRNASKQNKNMEIVSPCGEAYRMHLAETLMMNRARMLSFNGKPLTPANGIFKDVFLDSISDYQVKSVKQCRYISAACCLSFLDCLVPGLISCYVCYCLYCFSLCVIVLIDHFFSIDLTAVSREDTGFTRDNR